MGFIRDNVARQFIAVPDSAKGQILYKWPDIHIRRGSTVIVDVDEAAYFVARGESIGSLPPGRHPLDGAREWPVIGDLADYFTEGDAYRVELYFVGTREYAHQRFGGRLDDVQDPHSQLIVSLRTFGEYSLKVVNAQNLVTHLTGTVDVINNEAIVGWVNQLLLKSLRQTITTRLVDGTWPIIGLSAHLSEIESLTLDEANRQLVDYGLALGRMGNLDVNLSDEDAERLKKLASDVQYSILAGSFTEAARAQALQGAGEGMAHGAGASTPLLVAGLGLGSAVAAPSLAAPAPAPESGFPGGAGFAAPGASRTCTTCSAAVPEGAKFCNECGAQLSVACVKCGVSLPAGAKFCNECGAAQS